MALPQVVISGIIDFPPCSSPSCSCCQKVPVLPDPHIISSSTNKISYLSQISRTPLKYPGVAGTQPVVANYSFSKNAATFSGPICNPIVQVIF